MMEQANSIQALVEGSYTAERAGNISQAFKLAQSALAQARTLDLDAPLADALVCLAFLHDRLGHHNQAQALSEEALLVAAADSSARVRAWKTLGDCAHEQGDLESAEQYYHRAIDLSRQLGLTYLLHRCLHSLSACVYIPRGQFELAIAADAESVELAEKSGLVDEIWLPLYTQSWTLWLRGSRDQALEAALQMEKHSPSKSLAEGYYCCLRGDMAQESNEPQLAPEWYNRARSIAEPLGDPGLNAELRLGLSRYHRGAGTLAAAYTWAEDALATAVRAGSGDLQGAALIERALAAWASGDLQRAEADLNSAIAILIPLQAQYDLARLRFYQAALYHQQKRAEAEPAWLEAVQTITSGGYIFLLERERSLAFPLLAHHLNSRDPRISGLSSQLLDHLAKVPPPALVIHTLGRFEVRQGRQTIPDQAWRQRKAGELLRMLLVCPRYSALRDQVIEALWPDSAASVVQSLFHQATSSLRKALEPDLPEKFPSRYLSVERGEISLRLPEGSTVDFEVFEEHIRREDWDAALACYRGDLFPGDLYADWAAAPRERLKQKAIRAALAAAQAALSAGEPDKALGACQRALGWEPWQEEGVLLGMQACMAQHDRTGAIRLYQKLEHALRIELDVAPQEVIQAYYRTVLNR